MCARYLYMKDYHKVLLRVWSSPIGPVKERELNPTKGGCGVV